MGCGCGQIQSVNGVGSPEAYGANPDGLGMYRTTDVVDASWLVDALIGGAVGYAVSPKADQRAMWAGGGALAAGLVGLLGIAGVAAAGIYLKTR